MTETIEHATSKDGTRIGWRRLGSGPGLVVLHGGALAGEHYRRLGQLLAEQFTVALVDRRGRGLSGPLGGGLQAQIDDVAAVMKATGARMVFGHSAGALVALEAARVLPIERVAVFDPPVPASHLPVGWLPAYERALEAGDAATAMTI